MKILNKIFNETTKKTVDVRSNRSRKRKGFIEISAKTGQNVLNKIIERDTTKLT
ncbi:MAG: hypothetical protein ACTSPU_06470 [Promethearchaeota archaeon]